jgi:GLPGLI family protein
MKYLLLFFFSLFAFSQEPKITKIDFFSTKNGITNKEHLYVKADSALYKNDSLTIFNDNNKIINEEKSELEIKEKKIVLPVVSFYLTKNNQNLYASYFDRDESKSVCYKDELPEITWKIYDNETKKIGDYVAIKATGLFRGSEIEAYFCSEIPINFGPWKFKGLPGLILELTARNKNIENYHWVVNKINFDCKENLIFSNNEDLKIQPYKKIIDFRLKKLKEHIKMVNSQVPKGVTVGETVIERGGIEQKFEWEK